MALSRAVGVHMLALTQKLQSFGIKCNVGYTFLTDTLHQSLFLAAESFGQML